jgi:hypothetical protein
LSFQLKQIAIFEKIFVLTGSVTEIDIFSSNLVAGTVWLHLFGSLQPNLMRVDYGACC